MPISRSRRRRAPLDKRTETVAGIRGMPRWQVVIWALLLSAVIAGGWSWWRWDQVGAAFQRAAAQSQKTLGVQTMPDEGNNHVAQGTAITYQSDPPTSGPHYPIPTSPGFYDAPQLPGNLVHALEHGNIVIYYDQPTPDTMETLKEWARHFTDPWGGIVVTPRSGLGKEVILTAWRRILREQSFNANAAAAFIERYRGHGPENRP